MMLVDKNDPHYKAWEVQHEAKMARLREAIVKLIANSEIKIGLTMEMLEARIAESTDVDRDTKLTIANAGTIGSTTLSVQLYMLVEEGRVLLVPIPGVGCYYNVGPLDKLAVQG